MATIKFSNSICISAVDKLLNDAAVTYSVYLTFSDATTSVPQTITFNNAAYVAGDNGVSAVMDGVVYFVITEGKTVTLVSVVDDSDDDLIVEDVVDKVYSSNGTYTVSGIKYTLLNEE